MVDYTVGAEYEPLRAVRVHEPGFEALIGAIDPSPNHFARPFSLREAKREHREMTSILESEGVEVHGLHDDLEQAGVLDDLLTDALDVDESNNVTVADPDELRENVRRTSTYEMLQTVLLGPTFGRTVDDSDEIGDAGSVDPGSLATTVAVERAITNVYFQRDCQLVGDHGPILPRPVSPTRKRELPLIEAAWEGIGAEFAHRTSAGEHLEGGDFMPLGEFALLSTSGFDADGEEVVFRTTHRGGQELLESGAVGYDEVGLVRPPLEADEKLAAEHGTTSRLLHLDGWFNVAAEGLAVAREPLLDAATVEVYVRDGGHGDDGDGEQGNDSDSGFGAYTKQGEESFSELLARHDYEVIDAPYPERWATNFLTIDDGTILPIYQTDDGSYDPETNRTIERLKAEGIEVLPDGCGLDPDNLTNGGGGIHCMTSPITRG